MIVNHGKLKEIRDVNRDKKIVFASGVFDLFHIGHLKYLKKAKELGDILVVNVVNDSRVKILKGNNRPIINEKMRAKIINSLVFVDYVVINPLINKGVSMDCLKRLQPDFFGVREKTKYQEILKISPFTKLRKIGETGIISTTKIITKCKET